MASLIPSLSYSIYWEVFWDMSRT